MATETTTTLATPPTIRTSARQVIRFGSVDDVLRMADVVMASGSYPKDANKFKVAMMLMAGAEVGFGPMQSMKYVTPPIDGKCNLYGDSGLALVYQSGLLDGGIAEWIEGQGDDRKACCKLKRIGQQERTFEYPITLAKKLHSYKFQHSINPKTKNPYGGPWHDDTDGMLRRRALWRGINAVFADVLNGMTAEDVAADEAISVEATYSPPVAALTGSQPAAVAAAPVDAQPVMSDEQFEELKRLRKLFAEQFTTPAGADADEWKSLLTALGVDSIKSLTPTLADQFIQSAGKKVDPFNYPPASPAAA
jgi:hypothetical protein